jgi:hypothetical protein
MPVVRIPFPPLCYFFLTPSPDCEKLYSYWRREVKTKSGFLCAKRGKGFNHYWAIERYPSSLQMSAHQVTNMAHRITFNEDYKIIESEIYGEVAVNDITKMFNEMVDYSLKYESYLWLYDVNKAKRGISLVEVYYVPRKLDEILERLGSKKYAVKEAIVTNIDTEYFEFTETVSRNIGHRLKIFNDTDAARKWLIGKKDP